MSNKMSKDRVRFFLPFRYFQTRPGTNGMARCTCVNVLNASFGPPNGPTSGASWRDHMEAHPDGLTIVCRPSQFARFIVYRHEANECINGIKDLKPELFVPRDLYDRVADVSGVCRHSVMAVLTAISYDGKPPRTRHIEFDVSGNFKC